MLAEQDLPPDPRRQFESLADSMPYLWRQHLPARRPTRLRAHRRAVDRGHRRRGGRRPVGGALRPRRRRRPAPRCVHQLRRGTQHHLAEMIDHPDTVIGLSDAGAHVKMICDASMPTYLLTHWVRDRHRGRTLSLETVVHKQTAGTAAAVGLDRPRHHRAGQEGRPQRDRPRASPPRRARGRSTTCLPAAGASCRTRTATWRRSSAASSPAATTATPAPARAAWCQASPWKVPR